MLDAVRRAGHPVPADELQHSLELSQTKLASALARLEDAGALHVQTDGDVVGVDDAPPPTRSAARPRPRRCGARSTARAWT